MKQMQHLDPAAVVSMIKEATGLTFTRRRIFNLHKAGSFPDPVTRINPKTIFWNREDVAEWLRDNFAEPSVKRGRHGD